MDRSENLARTIRILPLTITVLFALLLIAYMVAQSRSRAEGLIEQLRTDYISERKQVMKSQVDQIQLHIKYQTDVVQQTLGLRIKERLDTAWGVINELYRTNRDRPRSELIALMAEALGNISSRNGGRYFLISGDGTVISDPTRRQWEGEKHLDALDSDGIPYIRVLLKVARTGSRELVSWKVSESEDKGDDCCRKEGSAVWFAPCELMIGTDEDVGALQEALQKQVKMWVRQVYGYSFDDVFIFDHTGRILAASERNHEQNSLADLGCHVGGSTLSWDYVTALSNHGGFIGMECRGYEIPENAITYVRAVPIWKWVIGFRDVPGQIDSLLEDKISAVHNQNNFNLMLLISGCFGIVALVAWVTFYLSRRISTYVYQRLMFDELTGLPNRKWFTDKVGRELALGKTLLLVNLDIDDFSIINERFSRRVGDALLEDISTRLTEQVDAEHISRVGSDEFLLYFPVESDELEKEMQTRALQVNNIFNRPFFIGSEEVEVRCTLGIVYSDAQTCSAGELVRRANIVLFRAKARGKNRWSCYDSAVDKAIQREKSIVNSFTQALENGEFYVVYQPQVLPGTGELYGVEALARWESPQLGVISPEEFISIAERNGFIFTLGFFIFHRACEDILQFSPNGRGAVKVSINISPRQLLHTDFISQVEREVAEVGIDPERVTLEITENLLTSDVDAVQPLLSRLGELGFEVSLDDFGTGSSSLSYITRLPISELKIDRSFVADVFNSYQSASLVKSIIAIGESNNMRIVAEGVETEEHARWLDAEMCDLHQGYYYSRPVPLAELERSWRERRAGP